MRRGLAVSGSMAYGRPAAEEDELNVKVPLPAEEGVIQ